SLRPHGTIVVLTLRSDQPQASMRKRNAMTPLRWAEFEPSGQVGDVAVTLPNRSGRPGTAFQMTEDGTCPMFHCLREASRPGTSISFAKPTSEPNKEEQLAVRVPGFPHTFWAVQVFLLPSRPSRGSWPCLIRTPAAGKGMRGLSSTNWRISVPTSFFTM